MLLQSHGPNEVIRLLPALPASADFSSGKIQGLKARGNYTVDIVWQNHQVSEATIVPRYDGTLFVLVPEGKSIFDERGQVADFKTIGGIAQVRVNGGMKYYVR